MGTRVVTVPEGFEESLTPEEFGDQVLLMAALKMFELGKLTSGAAAEFAGITRVEFYELASQYGVPVADADEGDLERELDLLRSWKG